MPRPISTSSLLAPLIGLLLCACSSDELGMNVAIEPASATMPAARADDTQVGELVVARSAAVDAAQFRQLLAAIPEDPSAEGTIVVTSLSLRNRQMEYPDRASALLNAELVWQPAKDDTAAFKIAIDTHSIPLDKKEQLAWLRDQACVGFWRRLLDEL